ncbi:MAG: hypothetical protein KF878_14850 [Planctomycetes bacterium]|nr:hypothetical protein [Planctomycetota bacterium]
MGLVASVALLAAIHGAPPAAPDGPPLVRGESALGAAQARAATRPVLIVTWTPGDPRSERWLPQAEGLARRYRGALEVIGSAMTDDERAVRARAAAAGVTFEQFVGAALVGEVDAPAMLVVGDERTLLPGPDHVAVCRTLGLDEPAAWDAWWATEDPTLPRPLFVTLTHEGAPLTGATIRHAAVGVLAGGPPPGRHRVSYDPDAGVARFDGLLPGTFRVDLRLERAGEVFVTAPDASFGLPAPPAPAMATVAVERE